MIMVKIRLWGTLEEVTETIDQLEKDTFFRILYVSDPYSDRGKSSYYRVYAEVEILEEKKEEDANAGRE